MAIIPQIVFEGRLPAVRLPKFESLWPRKTPSRVEAEGCRFQAYLFTVRSLRTKLDPKIPAREVTTIVNNRATNPQMEIVEAV